MPLRQVALCCLFVAYIVCAAAGDPPVVNLELGQPVNDKVQWGDTAVYCYTAPQFNIWRIFNEIKIDVLSTGDGVPNVYGASRDDVHGIIDTYIKARIVGAEVDKDISERARNHAEYFSSPLDLLTECPPLWDPEARTCVKAFSPFGRSCVAISMKKRSDRDKKVTYTVTASSSFDRSLPGAMLVGALLLSYAKFFAKSKVVWYTSGVSVSVFAGLLILIIYTCRKVKLPGTGSSGFTIITALGYGAVWVRYLSGILRTAAAKYWEFLAVYCAAFAVVGFIYIARIRRNEASKNDFRVIVLWSIRFLALILLARASRSSFVSFGIVGALTVYYITSRFAIGKSSKDSETDSYSETQSSRKRK